MSSINASHEVKATSMPEEFARLFPTEWQELPQLLETPSALEDGTKTKALGFSKKCVTDKPTDEEILELVAGIQKAGDPVAWLAKLQVCYFPEFAPGKDPTVKEYLEGNYDRTGVTLRAFILCYPHFAEKN